MQFASFNPLHLHLRQPLLKRTRYLLTSLCLFSLVFSLSLYGNIVDVFPGSPSIVLQKIQDVPIQSRQLQVSVPFGVVPSTLRVEYPMTLFWNLSDQPTIHSYILRYDGKATLKSNRREVSILSISDNRALVSDKKQNSTYFVSLNDLVFAESFMPRRTLTADLPILHRPNVDVTLSYLTQGMTSKISYYAFYDDMKKELVLSGFLYIKNESGHFYKQSKINLHVGGEQILNRRKYAKHSATMPNLSVAASESSAGSQSNDDYYIYDIQKIVDIHPNSTTGLTFFSEKSLSAQKHYRFYAHKFAALKTATVKPIDLVLHVKNTTGFPLPAGTIQLLKEESFIGEDWLPATSKRQDRDIHFGKTIEILGKKELTKVEESGKKIKKTYTITLQNNKIYEVDVDVYDKIPYQAKITGADFEFKKESASEFSVSVTIEPVKKKTLVYTIEEPKRTSKY